MTSIDTQPYVSIQQPVAVTFLILVSILLNYIDTIGGFEWKQAFMKAKMALYQPHLMPNVYKSIPSYK